MIIDTCKHGIEIVGKTVYLCRDCQREQAKHKQVEALKVVREDFKKAVTDINKKIKELGE